MSRCATSQLVSMNSFNSILVLLFLMLTLVMTARATPVEPLEDILAKRLRFSPEQIEELLVQPIPGHAQREIDYGIVEEDFVRFMMGVLLVRDKIQIVDLTRLERLNPWLQVRDRYRCASMGLNQFVVYLGGTMANDCLYFWMEFISDGPVMPFDNDFPLVDNTAPWDKPSAAYLEFNIERAKEFIEKYKIPVYMRDDLLSLKIRGSDLLDVIHETAKHPRDNFREELVKIERQPPIVRHFNRLICALSFRSLEGETTPWDRTCYAYWHRYMDMGGDGDTISDAHRNSTEQDPRQRDFRPPPPSRAQADIGERVMHGFMWKAIDDQMCESKPAACSKTLKKVVDDCRERNESLRKAYLDDPQGDDKYEALQDSIHECVTDDKRLAPYLPMDD